MRRKRSRASGNHERHGLIRQPLSLTVAATIRDVSGGQVLRLFFVFAPGPGTGFGHVLPNQKATYIDSAGLAKMVSGYITLNGNGGRLKLVNVQERVLAMLQLTRINTMLATFSAEAEAIESFR